jgi:hypothetical protein
VSLYVLATGDKVAAVCSPVVFAFGGGNRGILLAFGVRISVMLSFDTGGLHTLSFPSSSDKFTPADVLGFGGDTWIQELLGGWGSNGVDTS